jgi:glutathione S-transferase
VPEAYREAAIKDVLGGLAATLYESGIGRHSETERLQLAAWDLEAVASQLAGQAYLFGDRPTAADASVSAMLIASATEFFDTPLTGLVRSHGNLVDYMDRIKARFFAKNPWPAYEMA